MNRKIKFRVWDKEQRRMFSHKLIDSYDKDGVILWGDIFSGKDKTVELMQSTGLRDSTGVRIYEGDIVTVNGNTKTARLNKNYTITFKDGAFCVTARHSRYSFNNSITIRDLMFQAVNANHKLVLIVIGNIYENPELLND